MDRLDWNLVRAFAVTADAGSLSAAARRLGLSQPTLSRQVAALEAALGATLFLRVGKRLVMTDAGLGLLEHAQAMTAAAEQMALAAAGRDQEITGRVSISASDAVAAYLLPEILADVRVAAPQITLVVVASNALSDLRRREADIAIRHVRPSEPELIGRLVRETTANVYAAESWVAAHGVPQVVGDLAGLDLVGFDPVERFVAHLQGGGFPIAIEQFRIVSENAVVVWAMDRRGLGPGVMLAEIADRTPGIVRLLPNHPAARVPIWLVTHGAVRTSRRVRFVFDRLDSALRDLGSRPKTADRVG